MVEETLLGFDVGNSCVKAGLFVGDRVIEAASALHLPQSGVRSLVDRFLALGPSPTHAVLSSVNDSACDELVDRLVRRGVLVDFVLRSDGGLFESGFLGCDVETPRTTGVDRILSAIAALRRGVDAPCVAPVIVVDCGSAITVNLTTTDRVFRGGAILPGFRMMGRALHEQTAALPNVDLTQRPEASRLPPDMPGRSTHDALCAGIYYAAVGGVERLVDELSRDCGDPIAPRVYLTGGQAKLVSRGLRMAHEVCPHLVLEGLCQVAARRHATALRERA